jgi:hemoglobin-like flavoprotein
MTNFESPGNKTEKLTPEAAVEKIDGLNPEIKNNLEHIANKRGYSPDVLRNMVQMYAEDFPNNSRLGQLLEVLAHPSNDNELNTEKMEELLDLVA